MNKKAEGKMRAEERLAGGLPSGDYVRGYKPGFVDEAYKQVVGHYPTSQKTTVKDKDGNYHTGKRK